MIISQTPLRLSLAGGGTDFPRFFKEEGGAVLSFAIDKYVYVIVKERFDDRIYLNYSKKEIVDRVDQIEHELIRETMRMTGVEKGVEITTLADIPSGGSGLGSSSAITVGLLNALYAYQGVQVTAEQLAREACQIEIETLKKPIGVQDQYIAAYGGIRFFEFSKAGVDVKKVPLSNYKKMRLAEQLLLFYTDTTRNADGILEEQRRNIVEKLEELRQIREMARDIYAAFQKEDISIVGSKLHEGWELKKKLATQISSGDIDRWYTEARKAGATGGKIAGAGGGGFLLLYCPVENQENLRKNLPLKELPFHLERDGSKIIFNMTRYEWK